MPQRTLRLDHFLVYRDHSGIGDFNLFNEVFTQGANLTSSRPVQFGKAPSEGPLARQRLKPISQILIRVEAFFDQLPPGAHIKATGVAYDGMGPEKPVALTEGLRFFFTVAKVATLNMLRSGYT